MIINFFLLVFRLLPDIYRKPKMQSWLVALLEPMRTLNLVLVPFQRNNLKVVTYNSQSLAFAEIIKQQFNINDVTIVNNFNPVESNNINFLATKPNTPKVGFLAVPKGFTVGFLANISPTVFFNFEVHVTAGFTQDSELIAFVEKYKIYTATFTLIKDL